MTHMHAHVCSEYTHTYRTSVWVCVCRLKDNLEIYSSGITAPLLETGSLSGLALTEVPRLAGLGAPGRYAFSLSKYIHITSVPLPPHLLGVCSTQVPVFMLANTFLSHLPALSSLCKDSPV